MTDENTPKPVTVDNDGRELQAQLTDSGHLALQFLDGGVGEVVDADSDRAKELGRLHPLLAGLIAGEQNDRRPQATDAGTGVDAHTGTPDGTGERVDGSDPGAPAA